MIEIKTLNCGCIEKQEIIHKGYMSYRKIKTKMCKHHERIQRKEKEKEEKFKKFPNKKSEQIFKILNEMIDDLYEDGVDVSYFPDKANETLKKHAIKIEKLN